MLRVLEADLLNVRRSPRLAVLEVALALQRLDQRLFEIRESVMLPIDVAKMRYDRIPRTVAFEIYGTVDRVKQDFLGEAISELVKLAQTSDQELREEFFARHGGRGP
ncbi:MAG: hypothetical protein GY898_19470 [Proteobacteria bacterium]|nr:hypothetical protein [Pseudomonadota bacterium]